MNHKVIHKIIASLVFLITLFQFLMTVQPSVSFWDCGEFIAASFSLQVPHPPGAPLFLILGRVFSMIPFGANTAYRVNMISVFASAFSTLFLYLIVVKLKTIEVKNPEVFSRLFQLILLQQSEHSLFRLAILFGLTE